MPDWRKYSDYTESVDNVRVAISENYTNHEIVRAQADMQGKGPLLLNGDCAIDQPNAGASVAATGGVYCRDGLFIGKSGAGGFSWQRQTNALLLTARNPVITCDRYTVTTAAAAPGAGDVYVADMRVEGLRASRLQYGRSSARRAWLCSTARASIACSIGLALQNNAYDRSFPMSQALAANTTTDIAIPVPGDVAGTWLTDTGVGLRVRLGLGVGSTTGGTLNAWQAGNKIGAAGAGLMAVNGATLDITAWEVVIGDVAPGLYIPPDPQSELARLQREYERGQQPHLFLGGGQIANAGFGNQDFKVTKRAAPAITLANWSYYNGSTGAPVSPATSANQSAFYYQATGISNWNGWTAAGTWIADARL